MPEILPYQAEDCVEIYNIYRPFVDESAVSFELSMPSTTEFLQRLNTIASRFPFMVLKNEGRILGYAYASTHRERPAYRWAVETSIYLAPESRGKGYGKILYPQLMQELSRRGFTHSFGIITIPNEASVKLHAACGFVPLSVHEKAGWKMGQWHDVLWMRRGLSEPDDTPGEPEFGAWNG